MPRHAAGNYYTGSIWLGSTNITGQSVDPTPVPLPLRVVLKPAGTTVGSPVSVPLKVNHVPG